METRKVQKTGGSSFSITLPKEWVERNAIKEQTVLRLSMRPKGSLIIQSESVEPLVAMDYSIDGLSLEEMHRELISLYILGYEEICIQSAQISKATRLRIRQTLSVLLGLEIAEESSKHITVRNILNLDKISFSESTDNMFSMVSSMLDDAISVVAVPSHELAQDIIERDYEVNKLYFLAIRQNHAILHDITLEEKLGQPLWSAHYYESIAVQLERIGDHSVKIANLVEAAVVDNITFPPSLIAAARPLRELMGQIAACTKTIDRAQAHTILNRLHAMTSELELLNSEIIKQGFVQAAIVADSLIRVQGYLTNLAEIIVDQSFIAGSRE